MNRLNPGAFEFIPGKGFRLPDQPDQQPQTLQPIERPEQTEAPPPPPTISLTIGGQKSLPSSLSSSSTPSPSTKHPSAKIQPKPAPPTQSSTPPSKTFSTERAKTDTAAVALEVQTVADREVLEDLYGDGSPDFSFSF
jgi:peptide chain release factor subunit 3